jgi:RND family efflux transporter MFP subunit
MKYDLKPILKSAARHPVLASFILILAALGLYRFVLAFGGAGPQPGGGADRSVYVELGQATFGTMREVGLYYGSLTSPKQFIVSPRVGGTLKKLLVDLGDQVESGQLLARLDDDEYKLLRDQAAHRVKLSAAQAAEAGANLSLARNDMQRQTNLAGKSIVTQADYEMAENKLRQAEARLAVAESQLSEARSLLADAELRLSYTQISASWTEGDRRFVGERLVDEGGLVAEGSPILTVVSLNPLLVVVEVLEKDYPKIKIGQEAALTTRAWPGETFQGRVVRVAPVLSAASRQARVELEVPNPELKLKPGMFAEMVFVFKEIREVWSVPVDVPFRRREGFVIFLADPVTKTVKQLPVALGLVDNGQVELVNAPALDNPLVFLGQHLLSDGQGYLLAGTAAEASQP